LTRTGPQSLGGLDVQLDPLWGGTRPAPRPLALCTRGRYIPGRDRRTTIGAATKARVTPRTGGMMRLGYLATGLRVRTSSMLLTVGIVLAVAVATPSA